MGKSKAENRNLDQYQHQHPLAGKKVTALSRGKMFNLQPVKDLALDHRRAAVEKAEKTEMDPSVKIDFDNLLWETRISIRYNNHRLKFYDAIHRWFTFFTIILGSFSVVSILGEFGKVPIIFAGAFIAVLSSIELVFGITKKARDHSEFVKSFFSIEREILRLQHNGDRDDFIRIQDRKIKIDSEEPPVLRVLWDYCYNEMLRQAGIEEGNKLIFKWYHPLTKYFFDIGDEEVTDIKGRKPSLKSPTSPNPI